MERNTAFVLRDTPILNVIEEENAKEERHLKRLRESYTNKILDTRRSYNSLMQRRSVDIKEVRDQPSLEKLIFSRQMQSRDHQLSLGKIMKQLNLKSPDLKDKFYEYLLIPPSERDKDHIKTLSFYLKDYLFIQAHPASIHTPLCNNIMMKKGNQCTQFDIVILENPTRIHNQFKPKGFIVDLQDIVPQENYLCFDRGKYKEVVETYSNENYQRIEKFISGLELFGDVDSDLMNKINRTAEIIFKAKGQILYHVGDLASHVFAVFKGKVARKIIIEIQKNNLLPLSKQEILITNTIYEVEIEFGERDILGYLELLEDPPLIHRSETITASESCILIGIPYHLIRELRAVNLKWFRKQRAQKYPKSYQHLCNHYQQKMAFNKKVKLIVKSSLKEDKQNILSLGSYKIDNIKYVRSNSLYKLRKSVYS